VTLGPTEYRLLKFLLENQERVFTRGQLLDHVWGGNVYVEERTIDVHVRRCGRRWSLTPQTALYRP
jgi:two-component system phosphate regulon response regulator PhoB